MEKSWNCLFSWLWQLSSLWLLCMLWDTIITIIIWKHVRMGVMERSKSVMEKSWNSVFRFLWEPCVGQKHTIQIVFWKFVESNQMLSWQWVAHKRWAAAPSTQSSTIESSVIHVVDYRPLRPLTVVRNWPAGLHRWCCHAKSEWKTRVTSRPLWGEWFTLPKTFFWGAQCYTCGRLSPSPATYRCTWLASWTASMVLPRKEWMENAGYESPIVRRVIHSPENFFWGGGTESCRRLPKMWCSLRLL